ncbi:MAG: helix-turn-helix domain-containing protein [Propionibacteriaceae bacterium]|jgi:excisionase family DNA binding protein|nr:helix-turn-helix domain-containing protein [Propionibacteriaceae bacterium]
MPEEPEVLTAEETAALLRVSTKTVLALARSGSLPGEMIGCAWHVARSDVLGFARLTTAEENETDDQDCGAPSEPNGAEDGC